jgi:hypothetical protein
LTRKSTSVPKAHHIIPKSSQNYHTFDSLTFSSFLAGGFGRRASDGGANLQIFYPSSMNKSSQITNEDLYSRQNSHEFMMMTEQMPAACQLKGDITMENSEDSNDEIKRYFQGRGKDKRNTIGCTDDLSISPGGQGIDPPMPQAPSSSQPGTAVRQRRSGLLTVKEGMPPGRTKFHQNFHIFFAFFGSFPA